MTPEEKEHLRLVEKNFEALIKSLKDAVHRSRAILSYLNIASVVIMIAIINAYFAWEDNLNFEKRPDFSIQKKVDPAFVAKERDINFLKEVYSLDSNSICEWASNAKECQKRKDHYLRTLTTYVSYPGEFLWLEDLNRIYSIAKIKDNAYEVFKEVNETSEVDSLSGNHKRSQLRLLKIMFYRERGAERKADFFIDIRDTDFFINARNVGVKSRCNEFLKDETRRIIKDAKRLSKPNLVDDHQGKLYLDNYFKRMFFKVPLLGLDISSSDLMFIGTFSILLLLIWYFQATVNVHSITREIVRKARWLMSKNPSTKGATLTNIRDQLFYWVRDETIHCFILGTKTDNYLFQRIQDNTSFLHSINKKSILFRTNSLIAKVSSTEAGFIVSGMNELTRPIIKDKSLPLSGDNNESVYDKITARSKFLRYLQKAWFSFFVDPWSKYLVGIKPSPVNDLKEIFGSFSGSFDVKDFSVLSSSEDDQIIRELNKRVKRKIYYSTSEMNLESSLRFTRGSLFFRMNFLLSFFAKFFVRNDISFVLVVIFPFLSILSLLTVEGWSSISMFGFVSVFFPELVVKWLISIFLFMVVIIYSIFLYGLQRRTERLQELLYLVGDYYLFGNEQRHKNQFGSFEGFLFSRIGQIPTGFILNLFSLALIISAGVFIFLAFSGVFFLFSK